MKKKMLKVALRGANARMSRAARAGRVALAGAVAVAVLAPMLSSCGDNENADDVPEQKGAYIIAATSEDGAYLVQAEDILSGQVSIVGNGLEAASGTAWIYYKNKYVYRLQYRQGDAGEGSSYALNEDGKLYVRKELFQAPRYTTYGVFGDHVITAAEVTQADGTPGIQFAFIDAEASSYTTKIVASANLTGNGEKATISGILEVGDRFFSAVCPTPTTPQFPDSVWVAIFDKDLNYVIARDNRLGAASGRMQSAYYSGLAKDDNDNVYVFSSGLVNTSTTKPAGALRIKKGETRFDPDYFFDIEAAAEGRNLNRVWHITGNYFLLQMCNDAASPNGQQANMLAVVDVVAKSYRLVSGLPSPDVMTLMSITPHAENGKIAVPVVSTEDYPYIYLIDPATASASKGLEIVAEGATAVGKLTY
ncbi:MAG: DUF4374 domain-containing protein [Prevotellaceae bacterium]|jgi:hypothetical protein|nr:DUF4374 domain-containing protein [Prevotellaceae bacterium]